MNFTTTTLTALLAERLATWDQIDQAYAQGLVPRAIQLTKHVETVLTPTIREAYGL